MAGQAASEPVDAATVIVLRAVAASDSAPAGHQVFMVRRHHRMAFMGGAYVFPGGKLAAADRAETLPTLSPQGRSAPWLARLDPTPGRPLDEASARGLHVAAARELFEEAGVLLARRRRDAAWVGAGDPSWERLQAAREPLAAGEVSFAALLAGADLQLDLGALIYWAHWVTPSAEPRRYDTRFFVAPLPPDQTAQRDRRENTEQRWLSPEAAIEAYYGGEGVVLPPPTLRNLEELAAVDLAALLAGELRPPVAPILPKVGQVDGEPAIVLPWDPLYPATGGEALQGVDYTALAAQPSRVVLHDGLWRSGS